MRSPTFKGIGLRAGVGLAALHLALAILTISQFDLRKWGSLGAFLDSYAFFTISNGTYAFFAPGIGPGTRIRFVVNEPGKSPRSVDFSKRMNSEMRLRLSNQFRLILGELDDTLVRKAIATAWASHVLGAFPEASEVEVRLEVFEVPIMTDYRKGRRASWQPVYEVKFGNRREEGRRT